MKIIILFFTLILSGCMTKFGGYEGEKLNGKAHGFGTRLYSVDFGCYEKGHAKWEREELCKQDKYVGQFINGKRHGLGTYYFKSGRVKAGIWDNGNFVYSQKVNNNYNQVEKVADASKSKTKTKIYSPLKNYSDDLILSNACSFNGFEYTTFKLDIVSKQYVDEAKRRGLNCGVNKKIYKASKSSDFKRLNNLNNIGPKIQDEIENQKISDKGNFEICNYATKNKKWDYYYAPYVEEAKRRGLDCGVNENTTVIASKTKTQNYKPKSSVSSAELDAERKKRIQLERELTELRNKQEEQQQRISSDTQEPMINAFAKQDGSNAIISGRVTDNTEVAEVLIDGEQLSLTNNGTFKTELYIPRNGLNIEIVAYDRKGNKASKLLKIERGNIQQASGPIFDRLNPSGKRVKSNPNALALIIGVANYEKTSANALYADKDAQQFYDYATMKLGISSSNIKELVNNKADRVEIGLAIQDWIARSSKPGKTDIYVFFAGHGLASQDGKNMFLLPYDGSPRLLKASAIRRKELFDNIQQSNPRNVTVFLDTCYSGVTRNEEMLIAGRPIVIKAKEQAIPDGFTLFSAASNEQISRPLEEAKHGMFSYFLMKGMEGDADTNADNKITARELHIYVKQNVVQQSSGSQTPELQGDKDRVLVQFN